MKNSLLTLGLGFGLGFLAVSIFVGPQKVQAEITGRVRAHQARKPLSEARAESLNKNYFHQKKHGKVKAPKPSQKTDLANTKFVKKNKEKQQKVKKSRLLKKANKKALTRSTQRKVKKPLVLDFTS